MTQFGIELPVAVADLFGTRPERYFSYRLMPPGTEIPLTRYKPDRMAGRLRELGAEFVAYDLRPGDNEAALKAAEWAARYGIKMMLNNAIQERNSAPTPGFQTWVYPPELVTQIKQKVQLTGLIYDELFRQQARSERTGSDHGAADLASCKTVEDAYQKVEDGLRGIFAHSSSTGVPVMTAQDEPALFHGVARAGGRPGCKVLKDQNTPISLTLCMSAAHQYQSGWFASVDLRDGDGGPWYQLMRRESGHSPVEYLNALKLLALLNPAAVLSQSADVLWVIDSLGADLTEFGEAFLRFHRDILPGMRPGFDVQSWQPSVAFVHCEDGCFKQERPERAFDEPEPLSPAAPAHPLGAPELPFTRQAEKWLRAWYHLTWGRSSGQSLLNYASPLEESLARAQDVGKDEQDVLGCPPLGKRRDSSRVETHMHALFSPLNNVAVFDGHVTAEQLRGVQLVILCGSYATPEALQAVDAAVRTGARCLCQKELAPKVLAKARGMQMDQGYWWTVPDFDHADALEQFLRFRGHANQWVLKSKLGLLRIYSTDPWGNEIAWESEHIRA
jgi:hypothetical protein